MSPARQLCRVPGCSFKAVPELGGLCPDCYDEHYKKPTKPQDADIKPAKQLCRVANCSFKAVPELEGLCADCYDEHYKLQNT